MDFKIKSPIENNESEKIIFDAKPVIVLARVPEFVLVLNIVGERMPAINPKKKYPKVRGFSLKSEVSILLLIWKL